MVESDREVHRGLLVGGALVAPLKAARILFFWMSRFQTKLDTQGSSPRFGSSIDSWIDVSLALVSALSEETVD